MIDLKKLANAPRFLSIDMVQKANSGHPGAPMGMADIVTTLWAKFLKFNPQNPKWPDRDRFLLSNAHASALQYSLLYLAGYPDISLEDLKNFRQLDSKTAGHPEYGLLSGIEASGGPLGQGLAMAVGMAMAERTLSARFGEDIVNHKTYVTVGDGDLMEGISEEAISFAGHQKLRKLIVLWDNNTITIDGHTDVATTTDQEKRFEANGWEVLSCDGHDPDDIERVLDLAQTSNKPTFIACKTIIGYGSPTKAGTSGIHGSPLGEEEIAATRVALNWNTEPFEVPQDILDTWRSFGEKGKGQNAVWETRLAQSPMAKEFNALMSGKLPEGFDAEFSIFKNELVQEKPVLAGRKASQKVIEKLYQLIPNLLGGSADLSASNLTKPKDAIVIQSSNPAGDYLEYGIREHLMGAVMNGLALHGGFIPFGGTFFVFVDYLKPAMRLAALMGQKVVYVLTHDSIGVGEDGPTHQPIEQLAMLRALPNLTTLRPCDALEVAESWEIALKNNHPTALILSRQNLPFIRKDNHENLTQKGGYIISATEGERKATIIATGSEVGLAVEIQKALAEKQIDVAVVSMPSWDLFEKQSEAYRQNVLGTAPRISIEAASTFGWQKYADLVIGLDDFGASGPASKVFDKFGLTVQNIAYRIENLLNTGK